PAERVPALAAVGPVERHGETRLHARAQRAAASAEGDECLLEQSDPVVVDADALSTDASEAERGAREHLGGRQPPRQRRGVRERLACSVGLPRPSLGVAEREQELAPEREVAVRIEIEREECALELRDGLLECQPLERLLSR